MAGLTLIRPYVPNSVLPKDYVSVMEAYDGYTYGVIMDTPYLRYATPGTQNERSPDAFGWFAVWQRLTDKGWQIILYNAEDNKTYQVTDEYGDQINPQTDGRMIVWQGNQENGVWNVYMYDTQRPELGIKKLNSSAPAIKPNVSKGVVVWQQWENRNWEIAAMNDDKVYLMTNNLKPDIEPDVFNDMLIWTRADAGPIHRVIVKDLRTGEESYLDSESRGQIRPKFLNDGTLKWYAFENEGYIKNEYNFLTDVENKEVIMTSKSLEDSGAQEEVPFVTPELPKTNIIDIPMQDPEPTIDAQLDHEAKTTESKPEPMENPEMIPESLPEPAPAVEPEIIPDAEQNSSNSQQDQEPAPLSI